MVMVEICQELNPILGAGFFAGAPFTWVGLIIRYGSVTQTDPEYDRIDKKDGELPIAIELPMERLQKMGREELKRTFMLATLDALVHVGKKYSLPAEALIAMRTEVYREAFQPHREPRGNDAIAAGRCPNCGQELRTPKAKQCRKCGADWHGGWFEVESSDR